MTIGAYRRPPDHVTPSVAVLSLVQPLHGFTFALLHLACMRSIGAMVSPHLAATAQSLYAVAATAVSGSLTVVSGMLYARLGARGFLVMACLCAIAAPLARGLAASQERDIGGSQCS